MSKRTASAWDLTALLNAADPKAALPELNVAVSFFLAIRVALRSRGIRLADRSRIHRAIRARMGRDPLSFLLPPA